MCVKRQSKPMVTTTPCTRCESNQTTLQCAHNRRRHVTEYRVECHACGLRGPYSDSPVVAGRLFRRMKLGLKMSDRSRSDFYYCTNGEN